MYTYPYVTLKLTSLSTIMHRNHLSLYNDINSIENALHSEVDKRSYFENQLNDLRSLYTNMAARNSVTMHPNANFASYSQSNGHNAEITQSNYPHDPLKEPQAQQGRAPYSGTMQEDLGLQSNHALALLDSLEQKWRASNENLSFLLKETQRLNQKLDEQDQWF